jgi:DNA polymerase
MTADQVKTDLAELLKQTREYARYFGELGIETVAVEKVQTDRTAKVVSAATSLRTDPRQKPGSASSSSSVATTQPTTLFARTPAMRPTAGSPQEALFGELTLTNVTLAASTETLSDIWRDIGECTRCGLCEGRTQVVNTHGNPKARLMFVGEAPGADEDAQGRPFVGRAGQLLTKMIEAMGMKREEVIIGNVNRCRPPGNRQPTLEEAAICRPFLFREIAAVRPEVIVVMGNTALRNLLEIKAGISSVRGRFQDYHGIKVMPTFHPAYLLRDPSKKRETWDDLKKVIEHLNATPPSLLSA